VSEYKFMTTEGYAVRLCEQDVEKWRHVFSGLSLDDELNKLSLNSITRPWMKHKTWFFQLSAYLHKLEKGGIPMAYENNGKGVLFKNNRKEKDTHPDYQGNIEFKGGVPYKLSAWLKKDKNGNTYMSLSVGDIAEERNKPLPEHPKSDQKLPENDINDVPF
jgi:hypothetical protein